MQLHDNICHAEALEMSCRNPCLPPSIEDNDIKFQYDHESKDIKSKQY